MKPIWIVDDDQSIRFVLEKALMREDPFVARGLADVRVVEFRASQRAPDLPPRIA